MSLGQPPILALSREHRLFATSFFFFADKSGMLTLLFYTHQLIHGFCCTGPIAIILCIIFCIAGKANSGDQLVAKLKEVMQGSRTGYKHVLRWWLLVAIMYIGATLTTDVLTYCARWFHCTWCQNLGDRCSGLVDIFPPTFWSPGANATCWLPEDAGASGVEDGYLWHTWAEPGHKSTALYHVCNTIFWQRD